MSILDLKYTCQSFHWAENIRYCVQFILIYCHLVHDLNHLFYFYLLFCFAICLKYEFSLICWGYRLRSWIRWRKSMKSSLLNYQMVNWTNVLQKIYCVSTRVVLCPILHLDYVKHVIRMWVISSSCRLLVFINLC